MEPALTQKAFGVSPVYALQPDYQFSHNGYGLLQLVCNFAVDTNLAGGSTAQFARGATFPTGVGPLSQALAGESWTCVKAEERGRDGNIAYVTAHYAAIDKNMGGMITSTEATLSSAAVSEPIETHLNFSKILCLQIAPSEGTPLGGTLDANGPPLDVNDTTRNPYRAKWLPGSIPGALNYQFVGFLPAQKINDDVNRKAGVKSYLRPSVTLKLTAYTSDQGMASETATYTGWIADKVGFGAFYIPEPYQKVCKTKLAIGSIDKSLTGGPNWLITGVNMEIYGGLFKMQAELLLSGPMGWDKDIYPEAPPGGTSPAS